MKRVLESRLTACVLVVLVLGLGIVFAGDVIVKQGDMDVSGDLDVSGDAEVTGEIYGGGTYLEVGHDLLVDDDLVVTDDGVIDSDLLVLGDIYIYGKQTLYGSSDPPCVMYDQQTRAQIIDRVSWEVPPDKLGGAVVFFNAETKGLESYVAADGAFYDLGGKLLETLAQPVPPALQYKDVYHLNPRTGEVSSHKEPIRDEYVVRKGYKLDKKTGQFVNLSNGLAVTKEEAIEIRAYSDD